MIPVGTHQGTRQGHASKGRCPEGPKSWGKEGHYYKGNLLVFEMGPSLNSFRALKIQFSTNKIREAIL